MREVVADTGALISLAKITNGYQFIRELYDKIYIPPMVLREVAYHYESGDQYLKEYGIENLVVIEEVRNLDTFRRSLHAGEQFALSLAIQKQLPLLIEEIQGAKEAFDLGISVFGIGGLIAKSFHKNIIPRDEAEKLLLELVQHERISKEFHQRIIEDHFNI
ncbi:MAG: hypothetical protein GKR95_15250 [Gammaproteobacteria bacterium]|nr:hypothetical protein [Gammaproteobacteria bacterium]